MVARHGRSDGSRARVLAAAVALVGIVGVGVVACSAAQTPAPRTAKVERTSVTMGVKAPGALSALTEQNLGFPKGGQLTSVLVKVGDKVTAGQPLATVDDFAAKQALAQQQAQLASQQAALDKINASPVVEGAQNTLAQAQQILDATSASVDAVAQADEVAITNAKRQLDADQDAKDAADAKLDQDRSQCPTASSSKHGDDDDDASTGSTGSGSPGQLSTMTNPACAAIPADQQAVAAAKQKVVASKSAVDSAVQKRDVDQASGKVQVENARQAVVTAQNNVDSSSSDRPHTIDQQTALVASSRALVEQAQRDVDNTTLRAPVAGTVSVLNGAVGEFLAPSTGTSALAPGSNATIPGAGGSSGGGAAAAAAGASPARPGGTQFLVLNDIDQFQVVVPFNESDAATIQPNQRVDVTFDAIPDLTAPGSVVSVAPQGTSIAGVISYYVTVALTGSSDPRLRGGLTATANVVTSEAPNVLTVPSSAVRTVNGRSVVSVLGPSGPVDVPFQPGVVGLDRTEVVSGLQEGQQVLLPVGQQ